MQQSGLVFFCYLVGTYHDDSVGVDYLDGHVVILVYGTGQKRGVKEGSGRGRAAGHGVGKGSDTKGLPGRRQTP